jgi:hypothetical protein
MQYKTFQKIFHNGIDDAVRPVVASESIRERVVTRSGINAGRGVFMKKEAKDFDSAMRVSPIGDVSYRWIDPLYCAEMQILGFNWIEQDRVYRRMPADAAGILPEAVNELSNCCAGGQLKFVTDSSRVAIDAEFEYPHSMDNMSPIGQTGFDCYTGECGSMRFAATLRFDCKKSSYRAPVFSDISRERRLLTINLPLYNGALSRLKVGIEPGAELAAPVSHPSAKIVVYGTSITQGGCATRPGMCYTNILSRTIDAEFINLGFSGNGKGEPAVIETIAAIDDMNLLVIDYEANINDGIYENLPETIKILRSKQPALPILILSRLEFGQENIRPQNRAAFLKRRDFQRDFVGQSRRAGDKHIAFFDGSRLLGSDDAGEYAVDGAHLSDAGFMKTAQGLHTVFASYVSGSAA